MERQGPRELERTRVEAWWARPRRPQEFPASQRKRRRLGLRPRLGQKARGRVSFAELTNRVTSDPLQSASHPESGCSWAVRVVGSRKLIFPVSLGNHFRNSVLTTLERAVL